MKLTVMKIVILLSLFLFCNNQNIFGQAKVDSLLRLCSEMKKDNADLRIKICQVETFNIGKFEGLSLASNLIVALIAILFAVNVYSSFHKPKQIVTELSTEIATRIATDKSESVLANYRTELQQSNTLRNEILQMRNSIALQQQILTNLLNSLNEEQNETD